MMKAQPDILEQGTLSFSIESRIIRELGERLVKQGEVALLELIKNAYDADASGCTLQITPTAIIVSDDGIGMTLPEFKNGWMRIGTSSKESTATSRLYAREITGEKGIGRFAVRFLGRALAVETIADDPGRGYLTILTANFDWPRFDREEDLGKVTVPFTLKRAPDKSAPGTKLTVTKLRKAAASIDLRTVRTGSMNIVSPYQSLLRVPKQTGARPGKRPEDPGFSLRIVGDDSAGAAMDVASQILGSYVLRSLLSVDGEDLELRVFRRENPEPVFAIKDRIKNNLAGPIYADIRFFPQRAGTFRNTGVDGRLAKTWVKENGGVAVFDRRFRVHPYGFPGDDWLTLAADTVSNRREPRSSLAKKFFSMTEEVRRSTRLNYMLRLPYSEQLVGVVQVAGKRTKDNDDEDIGLIPAADREGFVANAAFRQLTDFVRGAVEAIASADRELQLEEERLEADHLLDELKKETKDAIEEIESDKTISRSTRLSLIRSLTNTQVLAEQAGEISRKREETMEVMSLLGVIAGFMTHEFGTAVDDLEKARTKLRSLGRKHPELNEDAASIEQRLENLREFVTYSQGYIRGAANRPSKPFTVRPRILQVIRVFGKYAEDRNIKVSTTIDADLLAPLVPVSLYNGLALNLFTNALKAVTAKVGAGKREISFRAWNENKQHHLEVSDTGIGIPEVLRTRIFDPLFTTTSSNADPLGSGMGLGLTLVRRGAEAFGGRVAVVTPPPGFSTCLRVRLPLDTSD